ncbi:unnamed protein product [Effrenium voratum]|nr:unnamed protein product [Effrenium voratum]
MLKNFMVKANPFDSEQAPFTQFPLKDVVALALAKHSEKDLLDHFERKSPRWQAQRGVSRKLYGLESDEEADLPSRRVGMSQKRYWYNAPSTTTTEGWQSVMQGLKSNTCICLVKGGVWVFTGSHAIFADWMHSIADVANYGYRLMELRRSGRKRDMAHPYGYAPLRYITADRSFVQGSAMRAACPSVSFKGPNFLPRESCPIFGIAQASNAGAGIVIVDGMYREILSQAEREKVGASPGSDLRQVAKYLSQGRDVMSTATFTEASSGVLSSFVGLIGLGLAYHLESAVPDVAAGMVMASMVSWVSVFLLGKSGQALLGQTLPRWRVQALIEKLEAHDVAGALSLAKGMCQAAREIRQTTLSASVMPELQRVPTDQLQEEQKKGGPIMLGGMICVNACCCFWIPLIFFLGAANTLETCENYDSFTMWMKTYALVPMGISILMQLVVVLAAYCCNGTGFKIALRLQILTGAVAVGMMIWGWVEYSRSSEDLCVGSGDVNPRTLALVFLIMGSLGAPGVLIGAIYKGCCGDVNMRGTTVSDS